LAQNLRDRGGKVKPRDRTGGIPHWTRVRLESSLASGYAGAAPPEKGAITNTFEGYTMRFAPAFLALAATGFLAACNSEEACTEELVKTKSAELTAKMTEVATTKPEKMAELAPKMQEIAEKAAAGGEDMQAACKAIDEMMVELSK
jgi:hypothetical protein